MSKLKEITMHEVFDKLAEGKRCFLIQEIDESTPIGQLRKAGGFVCMAEEAPAKADPEQEQEEVAEQVEAPASKRGKRSSVDHAKIVALRVSGRSVKKISEEMDISEQTVRNHLKEEDL